MNPRLQWFTIVVVAVLVATFSILPSACSSRYRIARLTVLVSGYTEAYLKNCGCSSGQKGGELRKARLMKEEKKAALLSKPSDQGRATEVLEVEIGNFSDPTDLVRKAESEGVVNSMKLLGYDSVGLGLNELRYQQQDLYALLNDPKLPVNAANLSFEAPTAGEDKSKELAAMVQPYRVVTKASGYRIGIIHLIDSSIAEDLPKGYGYKLAPCGPIATDILKSHHREANTWIITMANPVYEGADMAAVGTLSDALLAIGFTDPNPRQTADSTQVVYPYFVAKPYEKAKDLVRVQVFFSPKGDPPVINSQGIAIPEQIQPDPDVQKIVENMESVLEQLQNQLDEANLKQPLRHPTYVGYEACRECHWEMVDLLAKSKHALAFVNLKAKGKGEEKSANCSRCHVTGHASMGGKQWSGGWNVLGDAKQEPAVVAMRGVQCEACHGPGEFHVKAMHKGGTKAPDFTADGRDKFGLQPASDKTCLQCHDTTNSPKFKYDDYWPKIEHKMPADQKERKGKD